MAVQDKRGGDRFDPVTVADREAEHAQGLGPLR
jgi:fructose-1,6-bisphosphatase/inositol monophosphatase family enzyme